MFTLKLKIKAFSDDSPVIREVTSSGILIIKYGIIVSKLHFIKVRLYAFLKR